jgi:hypothetical protein
MTHRLIDKYNFTSGDMIIDTITGQRGILISRHRMIGDMYNPSPLFVWRISWFDSETGMGHTCIWHPKEFAEYNIVLSIEEGDFLYYKSPRNPTALL